MWQRWIRAGLLAPAIVAALALVVLVGLGTWQLQRKAWKDELIAIITKRSAASPLSPEQWSGLRCRDARDVGLAQSCEYRAVRLRGTFVHDGERHVYTIVPREGGSGGPGYWIMTPFRIAGASEGTDTFYVSRGFVPETDKDPRHRADGQVAGEVEIVGLLRTAEPRGLFTPANDPARNVYFLRAPAELGEPRGGKSPEVTAASSPVVTSPPGEAPPHPRIYFVDLLASAPRTGLPRPTAGRITIASRHLEYALTWYGLALTLVGVFAAYARSRLAERAA